MVKWSWCLYITLPKAWRKVTSGVSKHHRNWLWNLRSESLLVQSRSNSGRLVGLDLTHMSQAEWGCRLPQGDRERARNVAAVLRVTPPNEPAVLVQVPSLWLSCRCLPMKGHTEWSLELTSCDSDSQCRWCGTQRAHSTPPRFCHFSPTHFPKPTISCSLPLVLLIQGYSLGKGKCLHCFRCVFAYWEVGRQCHSYFIATPTDSWE